MWYTNQWKRIQARVETKAQYVLKEVFYMSKERDLLMICVETRGYTFRKDYKFDPLPWTARQNKW